MPLSAALTLLALHHKKWIQPLLNYRVLAFRSWECLIALAYRQLPSWHGYLARLSCSTMPEHVLASRGHLSFPVRSSLSPLIKPHLSNYKRLRYIPFSTSLVSCEIWPDSMSLSYSAFAASYIVFALPPILSLLCNFITG